VHWELVEEGEKQSGSVVEKKGTQREGEMKQVVAKAQGNARGKLNTREAMADRKKMERPSIDRRL